MGSRSSAVPSSCDSDVTRSGDDLPRLYMDRDWRKRANRFFFVVGEGIFGGRVVASIPIPQFTSCFEGGLMLSLSVS